ncbi:hypothetical protein AMJ80_09060 [bacterium SM23_31]|jgi:hypothetical protein|nr:MAG: hypothetical protein AMJ80_09060 [bacterium SM23_31]
MDYLKDLFSVIQSALISVGVITGGIWTYFLFVRQRLSFPKVDIELSIKNTILNEGARLIHAEIKVNNLGHVIFKSDKSELRLRQVVPVHDEIKQDIDIKDGFDPVPKDKTEIEWPMLAERVWEWNKKEFEIEPGESDFLHADYIIESNIKVVEFYFYLSNAKKKSQNIGWTLTNIYEFEN